MKRILVVANETVAGKPLIDAVRGRAGGEEVDVHVICPQNQPKHGYVIYDSMVREAAENRLRMTLALLHEAGIEARGEVMDPDPYTAIMDALGEQDYDEIVISTHPETRSGWLREENGQGAERLAQTLKELEDAGLEAVGQLVHPDPYTAIQNALQFYAPDDILISTFPETRSGWLRGDLIGRVRTSTGKPVEHVVSEEEG